MTKTRIADTLGTLLMATCIALATTGCQPGTGGPLEPTAGQQRGDKGPYDGDSVRIGNGPITIDVSGRWTTRLDANTINLAVSYRNTGTTTKWVDAIAFGSTVGHDEAEVTEVSDTTGVDLTDDRADNDDARSVIDVYRDRRKGRIELPAGRTRTIEVSLPFPDGIPAFEEGAAVKVRVPTPDGIREVRFAMAGAW